MKCIDDQTKEAKKGSKQKQLELHEVYQWPNQRSKK